MRVCPSCRTKYDEALQTCPRDGMPLLELSPTFARLNQETAEPEPEPEPETEDSPDIAVGPGMMVGEYMVERTIAEGGMGAIYAGIHPVISKRVAIKVISKRYAQDPKAVARFVLEARSVNQIGHHNIVDIFSIGELDDRRNYLVMELLDGMAMNQVLQRVKRLRPGEVLSVYEQLCDALDAAHKKGFIHRDLKPDNVIVLRRPPRPFIKILDFGLAKLRGSALSHNTEVGTVLGTPEYMAPEQCRGSHVDARTDIYALGVMLYELLAGQKPFTDPSPLRILTMQQHAQPMPLGRLVQISKKLETVVSRAMAKDPAARYASTKELIQDLRIAIPEQMPWTAEMVSWGDGGSPGSETQPPGAAAEHPSLPELRRLQPLTISGEIAPTSGELDDNVETLVSEQKIHEVAPPRQTPQPIAKVRSAEVEDEPRTEVNPVEEPIARLQPQPALAAPGSDEIADSEVAESTLVDDQAPIVLVDRPLRESRTAESAEFLLEAAPPPPATPKNQPQRSLEVDLKDLDTPASGAASRESSEPAAHARKDGHRPATPPSPQVASKRPTTPPSAPVVSARSTSREPSREELALGKTLPATEMPAELRRAIQAGQLPPETGREPARKRTAPEAFGSARKAPAPAPRKLHLGRLIAILGLGLALLITLILVLGNR